MSRSYPQPAEHGDWLTVSVIDEEAPRRRGYGPATTTAMIFVGAVAFANQPPYAFTIEMGTAERALKEAGAEACGW